MPKKTPSPYDRIYAACEKLGHHATDDEIRKWVQKKYPGLLRKVKVAAFRKSAELARQTVREKERPVRIMKLQHAFLELLVQEDGEAALKSLLDVQPERKERLLD